MALDEHGPQVQATVKHRLLTARFAEGADLGDRGTLARLAGESGLDEERVRAHLDSDEGAARTRQELDRGRRLGVTAVPTFVVGGKYAVQGAQPAETLVEVLAQVAAELTTAAGD